MSETNVRLTNADNDIKELTWNTYGPDVENPRTGEKHRKIAKRHSVTLGSKADEGWEQKEGHTPPRSHFVDVSKADFKEMVKQNGVVRGWIDKGNITVSAAAA